MSALMKRTNDRQYRSFLNLSALPNEGDSPAYRVKGQAVAFSTPTVIFSFEGEDYYEQIDPLAFTGCDMSDVIMNYNHGGKIVARLKNKTLTLSIDERGLWIDGYLGGTEEGRRLYEEIAGGYVDKMSFAFTIADDGEEYDPEARMWTVKRIKKLYDVSAVDIPAYDQTSISARSEREKFIEELSRERKSQLLELKRRKLILETLL